VISPKPLDQITREDIETLVADGTSERRTIEYKSVLPSTTDADKKEFVADVSSLANGQGGDLVYGIDAADGVPTAALGLANFNEDQTRLRFEALLRDGLDPRLHGVHMQSVAGFTNGPVFILRIPRSWSGPHRVKLGGTSRFYLRGSAGKFEMDTSDMRTAFDTAGDVLRRLREWRRERIDLITGGGAPVRLRTGVILVVHIVPFSSLSSPYQCHAADMQSFVAELHPIGVAAADWRINVDGLLVHAPDASELGSARAYTQMFRSGAIEAVKSGLVKEFKAGHGMIAPGWDLAVVDTVTRYVVVMRSLTIPPPAIFFLTVLNAKGTFLADANFDFPESLSLIDRNVLSLPEVMIDRYDLDIPKTLRPAFDAVWNACGFPRSLNYDTSGNWAPRTAMI
jgi:hypothetical protein